MAETRRFQSPLSRTLWLLAATFLLGVIFFSSTNKAAVVAGEGFERLMRMAVGTRPISAATWVRATFVAEKSVHVTLFFALGIILWNGFPQRHRVLHNVIAMGAIVGVASEILQMFFPGRDPTLRDASLNVFGVATGAWLALSVGRALHKPARFNR